MAMQVERGDALVRATIEKFFDIAPGEVDAVLAKLSSEQLSGGDWLFRQGDAGDSLYFLVRGRLQVWVTPEQADGEGPPSLLGEVVPGDSVGEIGLLAGGRRSAGVRAVRASELIRIDRATFELLVKEHPMLGLRLASSVASVLQRRTARALSSARGLRTVALVALDQSARGREFRAALIAALGQSGPVVAVAREALARFGAAAGGEEIPAAFRAWLDDEERASRFVVFDCSADASPWSRFALQQSDIVVLVAEAGGEPEPGPGEQALFGRGAELHARRALVLLQPPSSTPISGSARWLVPRKLDFHTHVRADQPDDIERVARILSDRAVGLVLAGGASRGIAHIGVYQALQEAGVPVDWIVGTSVGAILGATIATGWSTPEIIANNRAAFVGTGLFNDYTLPLISLIRGRNVERQLYRFLDFQIEDLPIPFLCPSCNLGTGAMNVHESGSLAAALRASAALPGVLPPAVHEHQLAIDGMVLNNLPVDLMQRKPVGRIIAVDLSQVRSQQVDYASVPSPWAVLRSRLLPFTGKVRAPNLMTLMLRATELGTLTRVRELGARADLLLTPPVRQFGMMEVGAFDRIVAAGYEYAKVEIAAWLVRQEAVTARSGA